MRKNTLRTVIIMVVSAVLIIGTACMLSSLTGYMQIVDGQVPLSSGVGEYSSVDDYAARMSVSSIELFCIGMILLLLIYILFTMRVTGKSTSKSTIAFCVVCVCSLLRYVSSIITYFNDGVNTDTALSLSKTWTMILFFTAYLLVLSLSYFAYTYISERGPVDRTIVTVSGWFTVLAFVVLEINYTKGIFYTFGSTNEYIRGKYYIYYYLILFLVFLHAFSWLFRYKKLIASKEFIALFSIAVFPIVGSIFQVLYPKYNPSDAFITAGIVISFLCLQFAITDNEVKGRISTESEILGISKMFMGIFHWNPKTNSLEQRSDSGEGNHSTQMVGSWFNNTFYIDNYVHENDRKMLKEILSTENLSNLYESDQRIVKEYEFRELSSGQYVWRRITFVHQPAMDKERPQLFMVEQDITEEKKIVERSAAQGRRFIGTCAGVYNLVYEWYIESNIALKLRFTANGVEESAFDSDWEHTIRDSFEKIVYSDDKNNAERILPENVKDLEVGQTKSESCRINFDGSFRWHTVTVKMLSDDNGGRVALYLMQDIDDVVREHNRLKDRSEHDEMTDLFNRAKLDDMKNTEYKTLQSCGILYFDINNLKTTNDTLGHSAGDEMIMIAANSIRSITNRRILGYRIGGDEMIAVVADAGCEEMNHLYSLWQMRVAELNSNSKIKCEIAAGCAWSDGDFDFDELLAKADAAMYENKQRLKGLKK